MCNGILKTRYFIIAPLFLTVFLAYIPLSARSAPAKGSVYHIVKKGDTLYSISRRYKVSVDSIRETNKLSDAKPLYVGSRLLIKKSAAGTKSGATTNTTKTAKRTSSDSSKKKPSAVSNLHFTWPVKTVRGVDRDGQNGVKSIGIVIRTAPGTAVYSAENGVVEKIGYMRGFGNYVVMKHNARVMTVYANLDSVAVTNGQNVGKGAPIGRIAKNDNSIHFQINYAGKALDALTILPPRG